MPGMDGTGPAGQGPMTGRRLGPCGTYGVRPTSAAPLQAASWLGRFAQGALGRIGLGSCGVGTYGALRGAGRGMGAGRGRGRGRRRNIW